MGLLLARVPSLSQKGVRHDVERHGDALYCHCTRFLMAKHDQKICSHVRLIEVVERQLARCAELHGLDGSGRICFQCLVDINAFALRKVRLEYVKKADAKAKIAAARKRKKRGKKSS